MAVAAVADLLREAVIFLAAAAAMVLLFSRFKLGAVLGYLVAGLLIGPYGFGLITDTEDVLIFGQYGIVLLLFVIGLDVQPSRLWTMKRDIFGLGTLQVALTGALLTMALLKLTSLSFEAALVVGLSLALSSTALVMQNLHEQGEANTREGQRIFSMLLLQDLAIVPLLLVVSALGRGGDTGEPGGWALVGAGFLTILTLVLLGRFVLNPVMRLMGQVGTRDIFVIAALLTVLGASYLMASFGLSMALGAFIAGVMLADSPYRYELEVDIEPFRGILLGMFFVAIGMTIDISVLLRDPMRVALLVLVLLVVKTLLIAGLARLFGTPWAKAVPMGLLLSQGGEFAFVLLAAAVAGLLIAPQAAALFTAVVSLSMAASLLLLRLYRMLPSMRGKPMFEDEGAEAGAPGSAILIGYGRFGQTVSQLLRRRGLKIVLIDRHPGRIEALRSEGWVAHYGDGFRLDVLRAAGAEQARMLVVMASGPFDPALLAPARAAFPNLVILVRAYDQQHYAKLQAVGMDLIVVPELFHSAIELGRRALAVAETPDDEIEAILRESIHPDNADTKI